MQTSLSLFRPRQVSPEPQSPAVGGATLSHRYEGLRAEALAESERLFAQRGALREAGEWDRAHEQYRARLVRLQRVGEELRPQSLRNRNETLYGADLAGELAELFA